MPNFISTLVYINPDTTLPVILSMYQSRQNLPVFLSMYQSRYNSLCFIKYESIQILLALYS